MQGSWLDPLEQLQHQTYVLMVGTTFHMRDANNTPWCEAEGEAELVVLYDAISTSTVSPCLACFPLPPQKRQDNPKDTYQMVIFE